MSRGQRSFSNEIPQQDGAGGGCHSSLNRAYPDTQLLLTEEILEGQDRGEVRSQVPWDWFAWQCSASSR